MKNLGTLSIIFMWILTGSSLMKVDYALAETYPQVAQDNGAALADLRGFLFNPSARKDFANGKADATSANNFLGAFPQWAQNELLEIVMTIATESMLDASNHVDAYKNGGVQGTMTSFSPAVRARVDAFIQKLSADPSFNTPGNLQKLKNLMPQLGGRSS